MNLGSFFQAVSGGLALLRRAPGFLELSAWFVGLVAVSYLYPYTWPHPLRACDIIIACGFALAFWSIVFRSRLDPLAVMLFGPLALLMTFLTVMVAFHLFGAVEGPAAKVVLTFVFLAVIGITVYLMLGVGIRKRRQRIPHIIGSLRDKRWRVRRMAARTLGDIAYTELNLLQRPNIHKTFWTPAQHDSRYGSLHAQAQDSLARLSSEGKPVLLELLQDSHLSVRCEAAWAIKQIDRRDIQNYRDLFFGSGSSFLSSSH